ncbi:hypothetical protein Baya_3160 [Bagarius yarrelli]|uniref:Uncharacterized protein n=1 Tax=Bagarius yarrelli TaxID=175774 RepID=A0A556TUS8_BAGYA|nr:hypothetical protein Baya_3160 [Bagarius yarrelli]
MALAIMVLLVLVACHAGKASVLHRPAEEPEDAQAPPMIRTDRCLGDPVQGVRKVILDSLNLQMEPRVSLPGMAQIREQWRNVFKSTGDSSNTDQKAAEDKVLSSSSSSSPSSSENSTQLQCCKFASQVFLKDLGWDEWIIYPESFTYKPCCEVTLNDHVPILYLDESNSLVINSVALSRNRSSCKSETGSSGWRLEQEQERDRNSEKLRKDMAYVSCSWLHWGIVCSVFALVFAQDGSWDCRDRDDVLKDVPADVSAPSGCTLDCTARTYRVVLQLQNRFTIRFRDSHAGEADEYCWSTRLICSPGQRLQSAFIFLPEDLSITDREPLRLQILSGTHGATVRPHTGDSVFPPECGLRFDVTDQVTGTAKERHESLCVKFITWEQSILGNGLMCPPFLVTTWEKWNQE